MRMLFEASKHEDLLRIIRSVRNRWRLRIALRGFAVVLSAGIAAFLVSAYGMDYFRFTPTAVLIFRIVTYATLLGLTVRFIVLPVSRRTSDERVALYLEEHEPSLKGGVLSGIEFGRELDAPSASGHSPAMVRRLVRVAIEQCVEIDEGRRVERKNLVKSSGLLAGATLTGMVFLLLSPGFLRHSAPFLLTPWNPSAAVSPYAIEVSPGDVALPRGADLRVTAQLLNFDSDEVDLAVKRGEEGQWERWPMSVDEEEGGYVLLLFDLDDQAEYFVEASGVRSALFRITVADLPYVQQIDLEYLYPAYTGLPPQRQEDAGDIAALMGTRVLLEITPTMAVAGGAAVVDDRDTIPLTRGADGVLTGELRVEREGLYRVLLESSGGDTVVGSPDYIIDVLADLPPSISFVKPGRDIKVTSVEEVFTEVKAEDDYGIGKLELIYSVNGGPEQTVELYAGRRGRKQLSASHTFYLEETELEPGDIVSYYARVAEVARGGRQQGATSDIYFMDVRPFDREYRQAEQQGGGGGGGGGGMRNDLSRRQRDVVAATFNMVRDRDEYSDKEFRENLATLALAQGKLREDVETLAGRITSRGIAQTDSTFRTIAEALSTAATEMQDAEQRLGQREPKQALSPEQRALQQLQRAEAAYREVQVARGGGGGGGGGQGNAEDLADLFELELDKMRNQYEQVQRGRREEVDNELDETLQKLRELARRQQQQNERMRARAQNLNDQAGGGGQGQRRLAQEAEDLARRLERLSREESRPDMAATARRIQEAADAMRRAAANSRNNGIAQGLSALDELREARRLLEKNRSARLERDARDALRRAEQLAQQQREMIADVERLSDEVGTRQQQVERLSERKEQMAQEVAELEVQLDRAARESRRDQRDASRKLLEAAKSIRDNKLKEKLMYSRGVIRGRSSEYARNFEEQIGADIDELRQRIEEGVAAIGESREQRLERSLERTRDAVNALESLDERIRERAAQGRGQQQSQGQQGQGQQGQGQQQGGQGGGGQPQGQGGVSQQGGDPRNAIRGGGGGPARLTPRDIRQFGRELRERQNDLTQLREQLRRDGVDVTDLNRVVAGLRELDRRRDFGDPRGIEQLQSEIIQGLKEFEYALRRQFLGPDDERLLLSGSDDVPEGYRKLVEEDYKALSRGGSNRR